MIHVLGLGRSGTHLLHKLLCTHPHLDGIPPETLLFDNCVAAVLYPERTNRYIYELNKITFHTFKVLKNHPELYFWSQIPRNHKGIIIHRNIRDVVASSLQHEGVLHWVRHQYPPNYLSGNFTPDFYDLSIIERLVLRWYYTDLFIDSIIRFDNLMLVNYDVLTTMSDIVTAGISSFLNLTNEFETGIIENIPSKYKNLPDRTKDEIELAINKRV